MRRRQLLHGGVVGLGAALAGCSAAADDADEATNDLVLVNHMNAPTEFQLEAVGPTNRQLTYEVEPNTAHRITDYVEEGSYQLTVENEIEVEVEAEDEGTETVTRTAEGSWNPEECHTCKLRARRSTVEIAVEDCTTATASPTPEPTTAGTTGANAGTGTD